jgi:hypothetical protein
VLVLTGTNGKIRCCCEPRRSHSFYGSYGFRFAAKEQSPANNFGRRGPTSTLASRLDSRAPCIFPIPSSRSRVVCCSQPRRSHSFYRSHGSYLLLQNLVVPIASMGLTGFVLVVRVGEFGAVNTALPGMAVGAASARTAVDAAPFRITGGASSSRTAVGAVLSRILDCCQCCLVPDRCQHGVVPDLRSLSALRRSGSLSLALRCHASLSALPRLGSLSARHRPELLLAPRRPGSLSTLYPLG